MVAEAGSLLDTPGTLEAEEICRGTAGADGDPYRTRARMSVLNAPQRITDRPQLC